MRRIAIALLALGCAAPAPLEFRVRAAPDDDPYRGADTVAVALEQEGLVVQDTEARFAPDEPWVLHDLPFGEDLRLRVELRAGDLVLARGRSFPFDFLEGEPTPARADVWLGTLGRFGHTARGAAVVALTPSPGGALGVRADGTLLRYHAHVGEGGAALEEAGDTGLRGAAWVEAPTGGLIGVSPDGVARVGVEGALGWVADATGYVEGAALAPLADGGVVVVHPSGGLRRLSAEHPSVELSPIPASLGAARAIAVPVREGDASLEWVVVIGDAGSWVIDPGGAHPPAPIDASLPRAGAALSVIGTGLLAVMGGVDGAAPLPDVRLVVLGAQVPQVLSAPPLFVARRDAAATLLSDRVVLIAGGTGERGPLASAELIDLRELPGDVSVTGSLPAPVAAPAATTLADATALVLAPEAAAIYFDPRAP